MPLPPYLPHIIYATALTSSALHLLSTRKDADTAQRRAEARISLLEGLVSQLRQPGAKVDEAEVQRVKRREQRAAGRLRQEASQVWEARYPPSIGVRYTRPSETAAPMPPRVHMKDEAGMIR